MKSEALGFYREAWLVVAQGGWWTQSEILEEMPSGMEVDDPHNRLWVMSNRHNYLATRGDKDGRKYAVTPDCVAPTGIPVRRMVRALGVETRETA